MFGWLIDDRPTANLLLGLSVKELWKSISAW